MTLTERLRKQLGWARDYSEGLLADFKSAEEWTHQVHDKANHALWFAGHIGTVDNFAISMVDPEKADERAGYQKAFGMGSKPTSNTEDYPPAAEVVAYMRERRKVLLSSLDKLSDEDLDKPTPEGAPDFLKTLGEVFELVVWHEGMHGGQVSVAHRALGYSYRA